MCTDASKFLERKWWKLMIFWAQQFEIVKIYIKYLGLQEPFTWNRRGYTKQKIERVG